MKSCRILCPMLVSLLLAGCGDDGPLPPEIDYQQPGAPILSGTAASRQASGVVQIRGLGSQCTGFIINHGVSNAPAYLMTNGHCVELFDSTTVQHQVPVEGEARFSLFQDNLAGAVSVNINEISWASMRGTDIAILKTDQTLAQLKQQGFAAYTLAPLPKPGTALSIMGVPVKDLPQDKWALRQVQCKAGQTTRLFEFVWIWDRAQAGDCTGILPGHSGSPVFDPAGQVVGIINTSTIGAEAGGNCYLGKPCELRKTGVVAIPNTSYWLAVDSVRGCFNAAGEFSLQQASCTLEQPEPFLARNATRVQQAPASWQAELDGPRTISLKSGPLHSTDCRDPAGYSGSYFAGELYEQAIGSRHDGHWLLCAAGYGTNGKIQTRSAGFTTLEIDNTAPVRPMKLHVVRFDDALQYQPLFSPPELSSYRWKVGKPSETDCADAAGYRVFIRIPRFADFTELPLKVCMIGSDEAGNESKPQTEMLEK